ncbi:MAG: YceI family protein [Acidobacteria bacterium]|nr:YceI family protein [Acidobacteriota bacterium]
MKRSGLLAALTPALIAVVPALAGPEVFTIDPARTSITFELQATGHDVEGTMPAPTGEITFDAATGEASGQVTIDLHGAQTGNTSRDKTMHGDVFETEKFPLVTFTAQRVEGTLPPAGTSDVALHGILAIHGAEHPMTLRGKAHHDGSRLVVDAAFEIPYVAWGMHDPSWFVLRVAKTVQVKLKAEGTISSSVTAAR